MFFEQTAEGLIIRIKLQPNASSLKVSGVFSMPDGTDYLRISIISVPEKGKANQELIQWLSKKLGTAKSNITILSGELDRLKKLLIKNSDSSTIDKLKSLLPED